jgi:hypothetical protein
MGDRSRRRPILDRTEGCEQTYLIVEVDEREPVVRLQP